MKFFKMSESRKDFLHSKNTEQIFLTLSYLTLIKLTVKLMIYSERIRTETII